MRSDYEERRQNRIERFEELAEKNRAEATARFNSHNIQTVRGLCGQPVLVGHHSEKRHRALLERADNDMRKSVEASDKAAYYDQRAASAESNDAISSDDPEAVVKLKEKVAELESFQSQVKSDNAKLRKAKLSGDDPALAVKLAELGLSEWTQKEIRTLAHICPYHLKPYARIPAYVLSNNNANIRRVRERLKHLEASFQKAEETPVESVKIGEVEIVSNNAENRVQIFFPGKPSEAVRADLKSSGWRWSPREGAWQRHLSNAARYYAEAIVKKHFGQEAESHEPHENSSQ
jgi:hypothetical protein